MKKEISEKGRKDQRIDVFARRLSFVVTAILLVLLVIMTMNGRKSGEGENTSVTTDPSLISHAQSRIISLNMQHPRGFALRPDGGFCVVGDSSLAMISPAGIAEKTVRLAGEPRCVATLDDGRIAVGLPDHITILDKHDGALTSFASPTPGSVLTSLAISGEDIWVADAGQRLILRYNSQGRVIGTLGKADAARHVPGLVVPSPYLDVTVAKDGIFVNNPGRHAVEKYAASGELLASWGTATNDIKGFAGCCNPTSIALMPDGRVVTAEKGIPRVKIFSPAGVFESMVATPDAFKPGTAGIDIHVDARGTIYLLDPIMKAIRVFTPKG